MMHDAQHDEAVRGSDDGVDERELEVVEPFTAARLRRELRRDAAARWLMAVGTGATFAVVLVLGAGPAMAGVVALGLVVLLWLGLNLVSARVSRELGPLAAAIEREPALAEDRLAQHLASRPLLAWVRLMLYHRLAGLRHRQRRFDESLAICAAVLAHRLGPAKHARAHLMLMLVEAALERRDLVSAYHALSELHAMRLSLIEALQRLALQTRYEVMCGYDVAALARREQKVELAELMPAAQCGAVHAIMATAARRRGDGELAQWLWGRAALLCTEEQLADLKAGGFGAGFVQAASG